MNKKYQQFVPLCLILAVLIIIIGIFLMCKSKIEEFRDVIEESKRNSEQQLKLEEQIKKNEEANNARQIKLKALKPIYKSDIVTQDDNLGVYGTMFDDIIKMAQSNGLLIRSIGFNMNPKTDLLYSSNSGAYNVCEINFVFVGTYLQLHNFLTDVNKNLEYLTSVSELNISAFQENTEYLIINESITLYSEKPSIARTKTKK